MKDGRVVHDGKSYTEQRRKALEAYGHACAICGRFLTMATFELDHKTGRGMGGGKRSDAIFGPDGTLASGDVRPLCPPCHRQYGHR